MLRSHLKSGNRSTRDGTEVLRRRLKLLRLWDLRTSQRQPITLLRQPDSRCANPNNLGSSSLR